MLFETHKCVYVYQSAVTNVQYEAVDLHMYDSICTKGCTLLCLHFTRNNNFCTEMFKHQNYQIYSSTYMYALINSNHTRL